MPKAVNNTATAQWTGDLFSGSGMVTLDTSGSGPFSTSWKARAEESGTSTTTPEELIAAAHSSCFSMAFSKALADNGTPPTRLDTRAVVTFVAGEGITEIALDVTGEVADITEDDFVRLAEEAKDGCPVSQALAGVGTISVGARLA